MRFVRRAAGLALAITMVVATFQASEGEASATSLKTWVSGSQWDPGNIISDAQFFDSNAMTVAEIQTFLNAKVPTCQPERSSGPSDPIICLKDYTQTTISRAADAYCPNPYTGASSESAATIIYKVAQACGVSPKVLLVTLQKEQGLVTHTWPSTHRYDTAMGYGCPDDGTGCMAEYYGFQNQLWRAARQFQRYVKLPGSYNYRAGVTNLIAYKPNTDCGSQAVFIQNSATAALYNYTPYVPNSAALNAMPGTGDSCSSYGNRNFWMYFWEWFGSPLAFNADAQIDAFYAGLDSATKTSLGTVTPGSCAREVTWCHRTYQNGIIAWSVATGAQIVKAPILSAYLAAGGAGGALGGPTVAATAIDSPTGNGTGQRFGNNAYIHSSALGTFYVRGAMLDLYVAEGWVRGHLGWPAGNPQCVDGAGCIQTFQSGERMTLDSTRTVAALMSAPFATVFDASGGIAVLGAPTSSEVLIASLNGDGKGQRFSKNAYIHSSASGTFVVSGPLLDAYIARGWVRGSLGWPVAAATCDSSGCAQEMQHGMLAVNSSGVANVVPESLVAVFKASGGVATLGVPTAAASAITGPNGDGVGQRFAHSAYIHSSASGAFVVKGTMLDAYIAQGWVRGSLAWPTASAVCDGTGCTQQFQFGKILVPTAGPAVVVPSVPAEIQAALDAAGGTAVLGQPVTVASVITGPNGDGVGQRFAHSAYIHSSASGAFVAKGTMLDAYIAQGWVRGSLGWPTASAVCDGTGCTQQFQFGKLLVPTSGPAVVVPSVPAEIQVALDAAGGTAVLGQPVTVASVITGPNGDGVGQRFAHSAYIHSSASGAFVVKGTMLDAYIAQGWVRGSLGWPTASAVCDASGCIQRFQFGQLAVPTGAGAQVIPAAIATVFDSAGGASVLGLPVTAASTISGPSGSGVGQRFAKNAYIHSSASGVFVVRGAMLDTYVAGGWVRGSLGWPKSAAVCDASICTQQFQFGTLTAPSS